MKKIRKKMCKATGCRNKFFPRSSFQTACSPFCAIAVSEQDKKKRIKEHKKETRLQLEAMRPKRWYVEKAQAAFNSYIRERDYGDLCISSGREMNWHKLGGAVDAGHYRSVGAAPHLRFHLWNCHAQSVLHNRHLSGSPIDYRIRLIEKIGLEKVEWIEREQTRKNYTIDYLKRVAKIFRRKTRILRKRRERC